MKNITFSPSDTTTDISNRALEILAMSAQGMKGKEIARAVCRTEATIRDHHTKAIRHYGARNLTQAVASAIASGDLQFRIESEHATKQRTLAALAFAFLAMTTAILDTPFVSDNNYDLTRHNKTPRMTRTVKVRGKSLDIVIA